MTYARSQIAPPGEPGCFHVVTRCVRRAFLCGSDQLTGKNFDHRRQWIEDRIHFLAESFAVSVYSYAVMSNHTHIVLSVDPQAVSGWTDEQVADRWLRVFPGVMSHASTDEQKQRVRMGLLSTPERLKEVRERLGNLSWFMRALNEPIARMANKEDGCTGRFWEGRFKCQALLEPQAVVSAMAYVDLNPARAKMADTLEESDHTSIKSRLETRGSALRSSTKLSTAGLKPVAGLDAEALLDMTETNYIALVQWTGEQLHPMKRGKLIRRSELGEKPPKVVLKLSKHSDRWLRQVRGTESKYYRAIGSAEALMAKAAELGQRWMQGVSGERAWIILRSQTE
jgi:REP element-mobilizing transposase RayT